MSDRRLGIAGTIARTFIDSPLTPLIVIASLLLGVGAVLLLPREEEPQIVVPMVDVFVQMPGATPKEIEERVTRPMEKLIWEIPGVEYVYSTSSPESAMVVVRFKVGENEENAIVRLNQKLFANADLIPPGASAPLIKPRSIDDVPILALTLASDRYDHYALRRIAAQIHEEIKQIPNVSEVRIIGGLRRQMRVTVDVAKSAGYGVDLSSVAARLDQSNRNLQVGAFSSQNQEYAVEAGTFLADVDEIGRVVVGVHEGHPVYLRDVAFVEDGAEEPANYVLYGERQTTQPAVTISVAKRKGANAIDVADQVVRKVDGLKSTMIPGDVGVHVTRNYGETAAEKSNELLLHMMLAIVSVSVLIWLTLGRRESGIVALAIPVTLALTLMVFYLYGYTLNRV
ncbi:MAG TPA: efflux RND transporter permease subunit, partial [Terriglobia bacterium]|nr:efflux RND transporter permease subunit [Terriglobia bacterium]